MSFPDYSNVEINAIEKKFYRHLCDVIVESIKAYRISDTQIDEHVTIENMALMNQIIASNKSIVTIVGHLGNWELGILKMGKISKFPVHAIYKPSSSKRFDQWLIRNRSRFGANLDDMTNMPPLLDKMEKNAICVGFLADQSPVYTDKAYWTYFLKQVTPVFKGPEKIARKYNLPVVYTHMKKTGRGQYHVRFELITDNPSALPEDEISKIHTKLLENNIKEQPEIWLWTHRRWKRSHLKPKGLKVNP